ncbi:hypothetical protein BH23CHL3_BH23CHL3_07390 [soil metagenome]
MTTTFGAQVSRWLSVGLGMLGVVGAVVFVTRESQPWLSAGTLLLAMAALVLVVARTDSKMFPLVPRSERPDYIRTQPHEPSAPFWLLLLALFAIVVTAATADNLGLRATNGTIAVRWLVSMGILLLAAWWSPLVSAIRTVRRMHRVSLPRPRFCGWAPWVGMFVIAEIPRLADLNRHPTIIDGDEGQFMLVARAFQEGALANPFGPGFLSNPNLYPVMAGWVAGMVGSDAAAYRTLSALVGAVGVVATWRLGRYVLGPEPAAAGAVILAVMPFHLYFSRVALNNITDPTALVLALLFLLRSVRFGRRGDAVVCGMALGFGFYGYFGGRAFPIVTLVVLALLTVGRELGARDAIRTGAWIILGFLATAMPLIVAYWHNPAELNSRVSTVSTFSRERLLSEPTEVIPLYLAHLREALLFPMVSNYQGFFRHEAPFLGWPIAVAVTIGVSAWAARLVRDRDVTPVLLLVGPWFMLAAGVALTTPIASQRLIAVTPIMALAAGSGLVVAGRWFAMIHRPSCVTVSRVVTVVVLLALSISNVRWLASEDRQIIAYSDFRTLLAWDMGWRIARPDTDGGEMPTVLFAGPPMVFGSGWANLRFQAPDLEIVDVEAPFTESSNGPALRDDAVLVLISERMGERCVAERLYADATMAEVHARDGTMLYMMFYHEPLTGWSSATTPAGTTFTAATESRCDV